ncbi:MAG: ABC transporter ATP-binding protein, partial [Acidimicrobiales bacterium]
MSEEAPPHLDVAISLRRRSAVVETSFRLGAGERLSLVGPSGAGKTTVLEAIAGLVRPDRGFVRVSGCEIDGIDAARRAGVALVRQPTSLFPHLSVAENICYGLPDRARPAGGALAALLGSVGLEGLDRASPLELSGGQRQRVAFARAIARPFSVLLLDEPFSALDDESTRRLRTMAEGAVGTAACAVLVSHDLAEAQAFGELLALMDEGRLLQLGPPDEVVRAPASRQAAELLGYSCFLTGCGGELLALHPDRVVAGTPAEPGVALVGKVAGIWPRGARYEVALAEVRPASGEGAGLLAGPRVGPCEGVLRLHVESPPVMGTELAVTALAPPRVPAGGDS